MIAVRFAPSPTGYLHIGGARTAIFNWLYARKNKGKFFLRIEDTDQQRSGEEMVTAILDSLTWLGLNWDGIPIRQSNRTEIYKSYVSRLLEQGSAYRSFVLPEEIDAARKKSQADGRQFKYRDSFQRVPSEKENELLADGKPFAVRFDVPNGKTTFDDLVCGEVSWDHSQIDDFVILRSDGQPTYHLAVIVDDHEMAITHIVRGADHISNTPKQIMLYKALGLKAPQFAHVPLILGADKTRLSKRHGATAVGEYQKNGILPEALFNYLTLLGWSPGDDREILDRETLISSFDLKGVSKTNAVFDNKKLEWMNGEYLSFEKIERIEGLVRAAFHKAGVNDDNQYFTNPEYFRRVLHLLKSRVKTINDFVSFGMYFFLDPNEYEEKARTKYWAAPETVDRLNRLAMEFDSLPTFSEESVEKCIRSFAEKMEIAAGKLIHPVRLAVTGFGVSPGVFETLSLIGRDRVVGRIRKAVAFIEN